MTTTNDSATFTLSQEEVYFVLSQVRARGMLGIDPAPLAAFDADQRQAVLGAAGRALQARGIIMPDGEGQLLLDAAVRATIHAAAFAPRSISAIVRPANQTAFDSYIIHHAEPIWVEHTQPGAGLHQFTLAVTLPDVASRLADLLGIAEQSAPPASPFTISEAELERIQAAASEATEDLPAQIVAAGADEPSAGIFAELLTAPRDSAIVQAIERPSDGGEEQTLTITILHNQHGFWVMRTNSPSELQCQPCDADAVREMLKELIERL
ncbi:hypothetical protein [Candidatus Viridilinea mediisalina]|uniref:ESX secretion-associated protein EspG n=1 Tax=Candidatus Viridilinea mediisalina TaxID=2024553 RepID=A0A2A6RFG5_9CHLR|nr:hypothetical protein [Candidatus Viridilinea mediisalina]PDW01817.1 hypothetical protein CJ255_17170 [Candidatus Viridilinea mediisalina]